MADVQPSLVAPVAPLLKQIALLLREGVDGWIRPGGYAPGYWPDWDANGTDRTGCPADHFILTEGTRMYMDDHRQQRIEPPYVLIAQAEAAEARGNRLPSVYWNVPVVVEAGWQADTEDDIRQIEAALTGLLCIDYTDQPVSARLSSSEVLVYGRDTITEVKPERLRAVSGFSAVRLTFTVLCSSLA